MTGEGIVAVLVVCVCTTTPSSRVKPEGSGRWVPWQVEVTAYCPCAKCCGRYADGITASGVPAEGRLIAAPKSVRFKTLIFVPGYGLAPVEDRGQAIKGNRLDLLFPTHAAAKRYGRKKLTVQIWEPSANAPPPPTVAKTPPPKTIVPKRPKQADGPRTESTAQPSPEAAERERLQFERPYYLAEHDDLSAYVDRLFRDRLGRGALPGWLRDHWSRVLIPPGYISRIEIRREVWVR